MRSGFRRFWPGLVIVVAALAAWQLWRQFNDSDGYAHIASGNGRIEATEIDIATQAPGRVAAILVNEGDFVNAGQVLARMDTQTLQAQLREQRASLQRARIGVDTAHSRITQRDAELAAAAVAPTAAAGHAHFQSAEAMLLESSPIAPPPCPPPRLLPRGPR